MAERDDKRFVDAAMVAFAIYCDTHNLSREECLILAATVSDVLKDDALEHEDDGS